MNEYEAQVWDWLHFLSSSLLTAN